MTKVSDLKLIEWQAPVYPMLDTAVKAIKVRDSEDYSPVVWDKGLYGEGINVAVLDTGVDNEHETFGVYEDQGVRRFIAGMNCDGGSTDDQEIMNLQPKKIAVKILTILTDMERM